MGTPIGRILLMPRGNYSATDVYNHLDVVRFSGASWVCKLDNTTNIAPPTPPVTSNANWQLLAEDGTVGGWSSLSGKPFDTIGAGLDVNLLNELEVVAENTYIPMGTSSDRPISGQGVADALTVLNNYYTKSDVDTKMQRVVQYAGTKQFTDLTSSLLNSTYVNNFFMLTNDGEITSANINLWNDNFIVGDHIPKDSHIAVVAYTGSDASKGSYVFDDFGGFVETDEYTASQAPVNGVVTFSDLNPDYGYKLFVDIPDETSSLPTNLTDLPVCKWTKVQRSTKADGTITLAYTVTNINVNYCLRILK